MPALRSWDVFIAAMFGFGAVLLAASSLLTRTGRKTVAASPQWPALVDGDLHDLDKTLRLRMVERLAMLRTPWSREVLRQARTQERDADMLSAIDAAIGSDNS